MRKNEGLMKMVVVAIVIFALMPVAMPVVAASCTQHPIPPTGQWTSSWFGTGISVSSGQSISITASGTVQPSTAKDIFAGPDGTFEVDNWQTSYSFRSDWGHEALIARIGAAGDPIFIGTSTTFTAPTGGEVWLGVNDIDPGNNAGGFVAEVCLGQAPALTPTPTPTITPTLSVSTDKSTYVVGERGWITGKVTRNSDPYSYAEVKIEIYDPYNDLVAEWLSLADAGGDYGNLFPDQLVDPDVVLPGAYTVVAKVDTAKDTASFVIKAPTG